MKHVSTLLLAGLATLTLCGYSCGGFATSQPAGKTISSVTMENNDPIQQSNQIQDGCSTNQQTPYATWSVKYNSDTSSGNFAFTWPKYVQNGGVATVYYYFDPVIPSNVEQDGMDAITAWNSALQRDKSTGGYVQITLAPGDANSAVTIYGSNDPPGDMFVSPYEGGETVIGKIPAPYDSIAGVVILMNNNLPDASIYASYLHELGHSLGLNHNQHQGSVMWPTLSSCFNQGGQPLPPPVDTAYLEQTYDPELVLTTKKYSTTGCPYGTFKYDPGQQDYVGNEVPRFTLEVFSVKKPVGPCTAHWSASAQKASWHAPLFNDSALKVEPPRSAVSAAAVHYANSVPLRSASWPGMIFGRNARLPIGASYHPTLFMHLDDHSGASQMSLTSLYLASTLVAAVRVGPVVQYRFNGPIRVAIHKAKILSLLRHELGPDQNRHVGDEIYIADTEGSKGEPFLDDLPLSTNQQAIVFLQAIGGRVPGVPVNSTYRFTAPHISKMLVAPGGRMELYTVYDAAIVASLQSHEGDIVASLLHANPLVEPFLERSTLTRWLRTRGVVSATAIQTYSASMTGNSRDVLTWTKQSQRAVQ